MKSRKRGTVDSQAVVVTGAVNADGWRAALSTKLGPAETEVFRTDSLRGPLRRGLGGGTEW